LFGEEAVAGYDCQIKISHKNKNNNNNNNSDPSAPRLRFFNQINQSETLEIQSSPNCNNNNRSCID